MTRYCVLKMVFPSFSIRALLLDGMSGEKGVTESQPNASLSRGWRFCDNSVHHYLMWPQQIANHCNTLSYSLALVHLIPSWLFRAEIEFKVLAMP